MMTRILAEGFSLRKRRASPSMADRAAFSCWEAALVRIGTSRYYQEGVLAGSQRKKGEKHQRQGAVRSRLRQSCESEDLDGLPPGKLQLPAEDPA